MRYERLAERVEAALAGRALNARQLRNALGTGEPVGPALVVMCDEQRLVRWRGPRGWSTGPPTYRLLREALPTVGLDACDEQAAVRELVVRYVRRYGPVREHDIAWWTGLSPTVVRAAADSLPQLVPARVEGLDGEFLVHEADAGDSPSSGGSVVDELSLLPSLDPYLQSYHDRERCLDPRHARWVVDRGGNTTSVILIGGRVAGIWDVIEAPSPELRLFSVEPPDASTRRRVGAVATDVAQFLLGRPARVREVERMLPLTTRVLGGFQSPLAHLP